MNYDNITKENFIEYEDDLFKIIHSKNKTLVKHLEYDDKNKIKTRLVDENGNNYYEKLDESVSIGFNKLFKFSHKNNIYFLFCSSIVYENTFENRFKEYENKFIDVKKIDFLKKEYTEIVNEYFKYRNEINWNTECLNLIYNSLNKKRDFLKKQLLEHSYKVVESYNPSYFNFDTKFINLNYSINDQTQKHEKIFCNNGFVLFEYLLANFVKPKDQKGHHKDVLFCYHKLFNSKPKYIHQKIQTFLDWYNPLYEDEINQTKTYIESKTINRESLYSTLLDLFKHQK